MAGDGCPSVRRWSSVGGIDIERLADHVPHVTKGDVADRNLNAVAGVLHWRTAGQAVGGLERNGPNPALTDLLGHLGHDLGGHTVELDLEGDGVVDLRQCVHGELDVDHRTCDGNNPAVFQHSGGIGNCHVNWLLGDLVATRMGVGEAEASGFCGVGGVEPDLGDGGVVATAIGAVVEHRVDVALDREPGG